MLDQVESKRLVGMDSMNLWIEITPNELRERAATRGHRQDRRLRSPRSGRRYNLRKAAAAIQALGPAMLIATRGSHGAMLFTEEGIFSAPAYPLEDESDPTGAGDSFAGGFFGYLAQASPRTTRRCAGRSIFGSVMGSFCVEDFGTRRLERLTMDEINERYHALKQLTDFDDV